MNLAEYEQLFPHAERDGILWYTPNQACAWRIETLHTKEPDTIQWIDAMKAGDILFDVGANMGQYSLLAAKRGVRVHAFEPESQNFALLCKNVAINKMDLNVTPWPYAANDKNGPNSFFVTQQSPGNSCNAFGESIDFKGEAKKFAFTQGSAGIMLDDFALEYGYPTHIKIDVDGFEHKVLFGARDCLRYVKSVLVETNSNMQQHRDIEEFMFKFGLFPDDATAEKAQRKEGTFKGIGNVIYFRDEADFLSKKG